MMIRPSSFALVAAATFAVLLQQDKQLVVAAAAPSSSSDASSLLLNLLKWQERPSYAPNGGDASLGRHHPITFANETHGFLLGGSTMTNDATNDFYVYDEATNEWTDVTTNNTEEAAFPGTPRSYGYGVVLAQAHHRKAYVGFGSSAGGDILNDWWELDMPTLTWRSLADFPGPARRHPSMVPVYNEDGNWEIHVGLGDGYIIDPTTQQLVFSNFNDYWSYDVNADEWTQLPDFPSSKRHHPFYFGIHNASYAGLGHSTTSPFIEPDFYSYSQGDWTRQPDFASYTIVYDNNNSNNNNNGTTTGKAVLQTTEARVAGTQFSIVFPLVGDKNNHTTNLTGAIGFLLSGDGDDHNYMPEGEFHAFYPPNSPLVDWDSNATTTTSTTTVTISTISRASAGASSSQAWWRQLPPHPGPSRWAPGSFVIRGTARAYFTSGYDRLNNIMHSDVWMIDLSPLFFSTTNASSASWSTNAKNTTNVTTKTASPAKEEMLASSARSLSLVTVTYFMVGMTTIWAVYCS